MGYGASWEPAILSRLILSCGFRMTILGLTRTSFEEVLRRTLSRLRPSAARNISAAGRKSLKISAAHSFNPGDTFLFMETEELVKHLSPKPQPMSTNRPPSRPSSWGVIQRPRSPVLCRSLLRVNGCQNPRKNGAAMPLRLCLSGTRSRDRRRRSRCESRGFAPARASFHPNTNRRM